MPIKNLTLGFCLLFAGQALATNSTHTVRKGDTISAIAARYKTTAKAIVRANGLADRDSLSLGQKLVIPGAAHTTDHSAKSGVPGYAAKAGDCDESIAKHFGISVAALHKLNPGVEWPRLQIGQRLVVPGSKAPVVSARPSRKRVAAKATVAKEHVIVRNGPSREADAISMADGGTPVAVLGRDGNWYKLRFPKGTEGWVRGDLIDANQAQQASLPRMSDLFVSMDGGKAAKGSSDKVIQVAKSYRGVRYRWGGMSRSGTDCSGFTSQVFESQGFNLPRTSTMQATVGKPVAGKLVPGDLVFFRTTRGSRISHVGIYVGNGKFIHASSSGGKVQVNSLREGYYRQRFATARRVAKPTKAATAKATADDSVPPVEPEAIEPAVPTVHNGADEVGQ